MLSSPKKANKLRHKKKGNPSAPADAPNNAERSEDANANSQEEDEGVGEGDDEKGKELSIQELLDAYDTAGSSGSTVTSSTSTTSTSSVVSSSGTVPTSQSSQKGLDDSGKGGAVRAKKSMLDGEGNGAGAGRAPISNKTLFLEQYPAYADAPWIGEPFGSSCWAAISTLIEEGVFSEADLNDMSYTRLSQQINLQAFICPFGNQHFEPNMIKISLGDVNSGKAKPSAKKKKDDAYSDGYDDQKVQSKTRYSDCVFRYQGIFQCAEVNFFAVRAYMDLLPRKKSNAEIKYANDPSNNDRIKSYLAEKVLIGMETAQMGNLVRMFQSSQSLQQRFLPAMLTDDGKAPNAWVGFPGTAQLHSEGKYTFFNANVGGTYTNDSYKQSFEIDFDDLIPLLPEIERVCAPGSPNYANAVKAIVEKAKVQNRKSASYLELLESMVTVTSNDMYDGFVRDSRESQDPLYSQLSDKKMLLWASAMQHATAGGTKRSSGFVEAYIWMKVSVTSQYELNSKGANDLPIKGSPANLSFSIVKAKYKGFVPRDFVCKADKFEERQSVSLSVGKNSMAKVRARRAFASVVKP